MIDALKTNPVRLYAIASAVVALAAHYAPDLPVALVLGLVAAILGVGEGIRAKVAPMSKVLVHVDEAPDGALILNADDWADGGLVETRGEV